MSKTLTEYEECAVMEIALWKAETPSRVARAIQVLREPLNEVTGRVVTGPYSGPQKVDHSGYLHLLRLFPSQPP